MQHQYSLAASLHYQLAMEALDEVWTLLVTSISAATSPYKYRYSIRFDDCLLLRLFSRLTCSIMGI